jgi:hypothetical protein
LRQHKPNDAAAQAAPADLKMPTPRVDEFGGDPQAK